MSIQLGNLLARITNVFTTSPSSVLYQILSGPASALDQADPAQTGLADQFSVTSATGSALDANGKDWGIPRRYNESDSTYRARILAELPSYASGPTVSNIQAIVGAFGLTSTVFEYGPDSFTMGYSAMGNFGFATSGEAFTFLLSISNPNNVTYNQSDLENAINAAKPARSTAVFQYT